MNAGIGSISSPAGAKRSDSAALSEPKAAIPAAIPAASDAADGGGRSRYSKTPRGDDVPTPGEPGTDPNGFVLKPTGGKTCERGTALLGEAGLASSRLEEADEAGAEEEASDDGKLALCSFSHAPAAAWAPRAVGEGVCVMRRRTDSDV
jgi:hypothetical protein